MQCPLSHSTWDVSFPTLQFSYVARCAGVSFSFAHQSQKMSLHSIARSLQPLLATAISSAVYASFPASYVAPTGCEHLVTLLPIGRSCNSIFGFCNITDFFSRSGLSARNLEDQGLFFFWPPPFDQSGIVRSARDQSPRRHSSLGRYTSSTTTTRCQPKVKSTSINLNVGQRDICWLAKVHWLLLLYRATRAEHSSR